MSGKPSVFRKTPSCQDNSQFSGNSCKLSGKLPVDRKSPSFQENSKFSGKLRFQENSQVFPSLRTRSLDRYRMTGQETHFSTVFYVKFLRVSNLYFMTFPAHELSFFEASAKQCCGSRSVLNPYSGAFWIQIRIHTCKNRIK